MPEGAVPNTPDPVAKAAKKTEIAQRRKKIAQLHLSRVSQNDIAAQLNVSKSQVSRDLDEIREAWRKEFVADLATLKNRECAALDLDERRARARLVDIPDKDYKNFVKVSELVLKIMDRRAKLLGLDAPQKVEASGAQALRVEFVNDWTPNAPVEVREAGETPAATSPPQTPAPPEADEPQETEPA